MHGCLLKSEGSKLSWELANTSLPGCCCCCCWFVHVLCLQSGFELREVFFNDVLYRSSPDESLVKPSTNWITSVASCDTTCYIGDSSGQLTEMDFVAIRNQKRVCPRKILLLCRSLRNSFLLQLQA